MCAGGKDSLLLRFCFAEAYSSTGHSHFYGVLNLMCLSKQPCPWARQLSSLRRMALKAWASFEGFLHSLTKRQDAVDTREMNHFIPTVGATTGVEN